MQRYSLNHEDGTLGSGATCFFMTKNGNVARTWLRRLQRLLHLCSLLIVLRICHALSISAQSMAVAATPISLK